MLASSAASSSSVATLSVALAEAAANVTDVGGVPLTDASLSETDTDTVSAASVAPVRESVNAAAVPSVTDVADATIDTTGSDDDAGPGTVRLKSPANFRPSASHTAFCAAQSVVARATSVTAPPPSGATTMPHWRPLPRSRRQTRSMRPPSMSNSAPCTVR